MCTDLKTSQVPAALELWGRGDPAARGQLIAYATERLRSMAESMLQRNPVRRWEQSDDLLQQAAIRLQRSLERAKPASARALLELAALDMRHALMDLARHYFGPCGIGFNHLSHCQNGPSDGELTGPRAASPSNPFDAADRIETIQRLYAAIDALPDEEREVVDLVWIHELSQAEAAAVLGVAMRTVARRWRRARLHLFDILQTAPAQV
jgi:RNA polymerase sigma-70 factor (ECF subfamily)